MPELDSLLVVYPDEIEEFERQSATVQFDRHRPAPADVDSVGPDPLEGLVVREWPPLEDEEENENEGQELAAGNPDSRTDLRRVTDGGVDHASDAVVDRGGRAAPAAAPFLLQASTADGIDEPRIEAPAEPSVPASLALKPMPAVGAFPESDFALPDLSFVRTARRQAFWRRPLVRSGLAAVCVLLIAAAGLQLARQQRDRIVASSPASRSLMLTLCAWTGCVIAPPRQIESVVIDSSSFNKGRGDGYQLTLTLKNISRMELATPAVEVTLTDSQDQALVRRVLLPVDLEVPVVLAAKSERSVTLPLAITGLGVSSKVSGYRLLVFYP